MPPNTPPSTSRRSLLVVILVPLVLVLLTLWFTISGAQAATLKASQQRGDLCVVTENHFGPCNAAR